MSKKSQDDTNIPTKNLLDKLIKNKTLAKKLGISDLENESVIGPNSPKSPIRLKKFCSQASDLPGKSSSTSLSKSPSCENPCSGEDQDDSDKENSEPDEVDVEEANLRTLEDIISQSEDDDPSCSSNSGSGDEFEILGE